MTVDAPKIQTPAVFDYLPSPLYNLKDGIFDRFASQCVSDNSDTVMGWSGMCKRIFERNPDKRRVLISGSAHLRQHRLLLEEEYRKYGMRNPVSRRTLKRGMQEYDMAEDIIVSSEFVKETFLREGWEEEAVHVVPPVVNTQKFRPAEGQSDRFVVSCSSTVVDLQRGIQFLLEAWDQLDLPNAELIITGKRREFPRSLYRKYRKDPSIHFVGWIDDISKLYAITDVYAFTSLQDGFPMGPLEAMASGVPVIVSDQMGAREAVEDGEEGYVVEAGNVEEIVDKVSFLFENTESRRRMGRNTVETSRSYSFKSHKSALTRMIR